MVLLYLCLVQDGQAALHIAAQKGHKSTCNVLLQGGASTSIKNKVVTKIKDVHINKGGVHFSFRTEPILACRTKSTHGQTGLVVIFK